MSKKRSEESPADKVIRWTGTLLRGGGVPALYGGYGVAVVAGAAAYLSSSWSANPAFGIVEAVGVAAIFWGHRQRMAEIRAGKISAATKTETKVLPEEEAVGLLSKGWEYVDVLPSGRLVVRRRT